MTIAIQIADLWKAGASLDKIGLELPQISTFALRRTISELKASGEIEDRAPVVRSVWTPRLVDRLRAYAVAGKSSNEIAVIIGISHGPVLSKLRELAVTDAEIADTLVHTPDPWSPEKIAEFVGLWIGGIETKTIAEKYGITDGAIRKRAASMYRAGDLRMVARGMGLSRSAMIGRAKRLRDASGIAPTAPRAHYRDRMPKAIVVKAVKSIPMRVKSVQVVKAVFVAPPAPPSLQLALVDLRLKQCRWIDSDGSYCGQPEHARSFCGYHFSLSYRAIAA